MPHHEDDDIAPSAIREQQQAKLHEHTDECDPQNCDISPAEWLARHGPRRGPEGGWMTTYSGKLFSFVNPQREQICIEDIAHHLSLVCHWGGACRRFFSVAQHSVLVSKIVPWELQRWALMHDAAEAYCGDMIRPLKVLLPGYKAIEKDVLRQIAIVFDIPWPEPPELKAYDDKILRFESKLLMHEHEMLHDGFGNAVTIPDLSFEEQTSLPLFYTQPMHPRDAEIMFLSRYRRVFLDDDGL